MKLLIGNSFFWTNLPGVHFWRALKERFFFGYIYELTIIITRMEMSLQGPSWLIVYYERPTNKGKMFRLSWPLPNI